MIETSSEPLLAAPNRDIAAKLREVAELLALQDASPFRVAAYRRAADTIEALPRGLAEIISAGGLARLTELPNIDHAMASVVGELARTGRLTLLDRLRGTLDAESLFRTIPGVGPELARRIHETLHVDTLEALEVAAHDGRLETVPGLGRRRVAAVRASLGALLGRLRSRGFVAGAVESEPDVATLLDVDAEYRRRAAAGELRTIAPRRMNPAAEAWLPILHTQRGRWHFTALYSNTSRAHALGRTHDWVILYFFDDHHPEHQRTVVTETHGTLQGSRVVRGREAECLRRIAP